jgi:hypothetical protein
MPETLGSALMSTNPLPLKERMQIPRVQMPELDAEIRAHNFAK